eukprot:scaffold282655_cov19-Tisochrysis_lutea.AAC.1
METCTFSSGSATWDARATAPQPVATWSCCSMHAVGAAPGTSRRASRPLARKGTRKSLRGS